MTRPRGFTLIELLVVIAIIAILAAILFPVFAKAREKARQSSCGSNVKQFTVALMQYAQDYDETLVTGSWPYSGSSAVGWLDLLDPYMKNKQVKACPSQKTIMTDSQGYGWNYQEFGYMSATDAGWATALAQVTAPAETIVLGDSEDVGTRTPDNTWYYVYLYRRHATQLPKRHNGGGNMAFLDGHAKWQPQSELRKSTPGVAAPWRWAP